MGRRKFGKKIAVVILIAVVLLAIGVILYQRAKEVVFYSKRIYPKQTYLAWDGNPPPLGYVFRAIYYDMYVNGSVVYGSGTNQTSWTCPEYVYGQEGNSGYRVDYAVVWTDGTIAIHLP